MQLKDFNYGFPLVSSGDFILCPRCKTHLYTVNKNIFVGDVLRGSLFDNAHGVPKLRDGRTSESFCCRRPWFVNGSMFTQNGWQPRDPYKREDLQ